VLTYASAVISDLLQLRALPDFLTWQSAFYIRGGEIPGASLDRRSASL